MSQRKNLKKFIDRSFRDPVAGILLKNSNLTKIQYETLIIDLLSDALSDNRIKYSEKALLRSKKVSRGSFNRTLSQARRNIISAIYTILLLSYIGLFESAPFDEYQILSEKLREYVKIVQESNSSQARGIIRRVEEELRKGIRELAEPKSLRIT